MGIFKTMAWLAYIVLVVGIVVGEIFYLNSFIGGMALFLIVIATIFIMAFWGYILFERG
jgi:hypothetical protein